MGSQSRKRSGNHLRLVGVLAPALLLGLVLAACETRSSSRPASIAKPRPSYSAAAGMVYTPFVAKRIPLMSTPLEIRNDYVYPMTFMRQKLVWTDDESLWHMTFPSRRYAYAGIEFRQRVDISDVRREGRLVFRLRPARLAPFLSVALVDHPTNQAVRAMTDYWLQEAGPFEGDGWAVVDIALTNFPAEALPVVDGMTDPAEGVDLPRRPFEWACVKEIRFVSGGGRIPNQEVVVKNMRFQR